MKNLAAVGAVFQLTRHMRRDGKDGKKHCEVFLNRSFNVIVFLPQRQATKFFQQSSFTFYLQQQSASCEEEASLNKLGNNDWHQEFITRIWHFSENIQ